MYAKNTLGTTTTGYVDITKLRSIKNFSEEFGKQHKGSGFSTTYIYALFNPENTRQAAVDLREKYVLVSIDGLQFVTEADNFTTAVPATRQHHRPSTAAAKKAAPARKTAPAAPQPAKKTAKAKVATKAPAKKLARKSPVNAPQGKRRGRPPGSKNKPK